MYSAILFLVLGVNVPITPDILINACNENAAKIETFTADVRAEGNRGVITVRSIGNMYYESSQKFRMINKALLDGGLASDIGSNNTTFWFYSRRMRPANLYWGLYSELPTMKLETTLNPKLMMEILGVVPTNIKNGKIAEKDGYIWHVEKIGDIYKYTQYDKSKMVPVGHFLYDSNKKNISSAKIVKVEFVKGLHLPAEIDIVWPKEKLTINLRLSNHKVNVGIHENMWVMPNMAKKEHLSK